MRLESFSINGKRLTSLTFTSPRLRSPACVSPWTKRACRQIDYKTHKDVLEKHLRIDFSLNVSLNGVVVGEMCKVLGVVKLKCSVKYHACVMRNTRSLAQPVISSVGSDQSDSLVLRFLFYSCLFTMHEQITNRNFLL